MQAMAFPRRPCRPICHLTSTTIQVSKLLKILFKDWVHNFRLVKARILKSTQGETLGPTQFHIALLLMQLFLKLTGAGDYFWEDILNDTEGSIMDDMEDLSDINSEASFQSLPIDYSLQNYLWPIDQDIPLMNMDIDQKMV